MARRGFELAGLEEDLNVFATTVNQFFLEPYSDQYSMLLNLFTSKIWMVKSPPRTFKSLITVLNLVKYLKI